MEINSVIILSVERYVILACMYYSCLSRESGIFFLQKEVVKLKVHSKGVDTDIPRQQNRDSQGSCCFK